MRRKPLERVRQGLDPIGVIRDPKDDRPIHVTSDNIADLTWEEGMRLMAMSSDERIAMIANEPEWIRSKPRGRGN